MFFARNLCLIVGLTVSTLSYATPNSGDFRISTDFPLTASFFWAGTALPDGRYAVWNGDTIYFQHSVGVDAWTAVASGYAGDPAFVIPIPNTTDLLLGGGYGGDVYRFDWSAPADYSAAVSANIGAHFSAVYLTDTLLAIDRADFDVPNEIVVLDMAAVGPLTQSVDARTVLSLPASNTRTQVIEKPSGSYSASIAVDEGSGLFYVTDAGNGLVKSFALSDVFNAYNTSTPLDWDTAGTSIGSAFQFPLGGVAGLTASGNLVMGGFGSVVEVDPGSATAVKSLDPAGTGPFYTIIYNSVTEDLIAIQSDYPNPDIIHTTQEELASVPVNPLWIGLVMIVVPIAYLRRRMRME